MKFLSLGVVASTFAVICVSGNRLSRSGKDLSDFDALVIPQRQLSETPINSLTKKSRLSRRKLANAINIQDLHFTKRANEKAESDEHESKEQESDEDERTGNEANEAKEHTLVRIAAVSANKSENEVEPSENEPKENENELKENEPQENENELKENEPQENENELKENEPQENENELKENEPQENENELKENEPKENENELKENEPQENENELKEKEPQENELGVIQQDVKEFETNKKDIPQEASTNSKSVQNESNEVKDGSSNDVNEQEQRTSEPVMNKLDLVSSLYGDASENDLVNNGLNDPVYNDNEEIDAETIARVFQSPPEDLLADDIPYENDELAKESNGIKDASSEQVNDIELVNIGVPSRVEYNSPKAEENKAQDYSKPPKALTKEPGYSYSVSGHEIYSEDGDEFEFLQDRMENQLRNKNANIKDKQV
ncbi:hypothetical protein K501DRAFT_271876 [Backusella circina FSU 941]|nr:hypothetical protein K501DRAFT_271876 [Backusella circina FSU 941]